MRGLGNDISVNFLLGPPVKKGDDRDVKTAERAGNHFTRGALFDVMTCSFLADNSGETFMRERQQPIIEISGSAII